MKIRTARKPEASGTSPHTAVLAFQKMCLDAGSHESSVIKETFKKLFGKKCTLPYTLAKDCISYQLQRPRE
jgi:hypothetical protein